jgi:hypothetical protein
MDELEWTEWMECRDGWGDWVMEREMGRQGQVLVLVLVFFWFLDGRVNVAHQKGDRQTSGWGEKREGRNQKSMRETRDDCRFGLPLRLQG